jgi:hypothetical protein
MKPAGKIADPRPSFTKDAGYEKKMDGESPNIVFLTDSNAATVLFTASTTTTAQKKSKLKSTNKTRPLSSQNLFPRILSSLLLPWERSHRAVRTRSLTESVAGIIVKSRRQRRKGKIKYFRLTRHLSLIQTSTCAQLD